MAPPPGDFRVRPTADRAREALFSILQRWPMGPFLDLCAGTGAMGVEAWSRGYDPVTCVEAFEPGLGCLRRNIEGTSIAIQMMDINRLDAYSFRNQGVIFCDPPYELAHPLWGLMAARFAHWIAPGGILVFETDRGTVLELQNGWELAETRDYGAARFHLWTPA